MTQNEHKCEKFNNFQTVISKFQFFVISNFSDVYMMRFRIDYNIWLSVTYFSSLYFSIQWIYLHDDVLHNVDSFDDFSKSNYSNVQRIIGQSHALWFLWSLNLVVGWKDRIDTGDWLYYVECCDRMYLLYPWAVTKYTPYFIC